MTINRPISEDDLHAYVDERLDSARRAEVDAYLKQHSETAKRVEGFARQRAKLREVLAPIAREPLPTNLNLGRIIEGRRRVPMAWWRSVAAASVLVIAGGVSGWFGHAAMQAASGGVAALAREASTNYAVFTSDRIRPVELRAGDSADLARWVATRLERPVEIPNIASSGFRFMGGRLVATPHGAAGMFMYDDDRGSRLVMLMRPMAVEQDAPISLYENNGVSGLAWAQDGMGFSLVGPPHATLRPIADAIRRQTAPSR